MNDFSYDSDLIGGSLQVREGRIVADLMLHDVSPEEWRQSIIVENRLQKRSPSTAIRIAQSIRKRLERMDSAFWVALRDGDDNLATQVAFCAALERNLLLVEFMERVVGDAYLTHAEALAVYQWSDFLSDCAHRDPAIHDWAPSSRKKMGQVVFRMLAEVGFLRDTRSLRLQKIVVRPEVVALLSDNYRYRLLACIKMPEKGGL